MLRSHEVAFTPAPTLADCLLQVFMAVNAFYSRQPALAMDRGIVNNLNLMRRTVHDPQLSRWSVLSIGCQVIERSPAATDIEVQAAIERARNVLAAHNV